MPVLGRFLGFLASDIAKRPEHLQSVNTDLVHRLRTLAGAIEVNFDAGRQLTLQRIRRVAYHIVVSKPYFVRAEWDSDAEVSVTSSDSISGLFTEADTIEALYAKLQTMVPELLAANGCLPLCEAIPLKIKMFG